jgi:hypothetical protein
MLENLLNLSFVERHEGGGYLIRNAKPPIRAVKAQATEAAKRGYIYEVSTYASISVSHIDSCAFGYPDSLRDSLEKSAGLSPDKQGRVLLPVYNEDLRKLEWVNRCVPEGAIGVFCQTSAKGRDYIFIEQKDEDAGPYVVLPALVPCRFRGNQETQSRMLLDEVKRMCKDYPEVDLGKVAPLLDRSQTCAGGDFHWVYGFFTSLYKRGLKTYYSVTGQRLTAGAGASDESLLLFSMFSGETTQSPPYSSICAVNAMIGLNKYKEDERVEEAVNKRFEERKAGMLRSNRVASRVVRKRTKI